MLLGLAKGTKGTLSSLTIKALRITPPLQYASTWASGVADELPIASDKNAVNTLPASKRRSIFSNFSAPDAHLKELHPQVLVNCMKNNIFITVSRTPGHLLFKLSAGTAGFSGGSKTSPKSALAMLDILQRRLTELGISSIRLNFRGINSARPIMMGQFRRLGINVTEVVDTTGVPFNGCRPPKAKRL
jgi:small subunit ribosomal protein S11